MASHSRCQITPFIIQSCIMSSGILAPSPKYRSGHPTGHPKLLQLESPGGSSEITLFKMKAADYCVFQS